MINIKSGDILMEIPGLKILTTVVPVGTKTGMALHISAALL